MATSLENVLTPASIKQAYKAMDDLTTDEVIPNPVDPLFEHK
jgi:hypothetical protein